MAYVFSFSEPFYNEIGSTVLSRYAKWRTFTERFEDDPTIQVTYMFDDSTAEELANDIGDDERFGGYWPLGATLV